MEKRIRYQNYVEHYKKDAEFQNYFETTPFEEQNIRRRYEQLFSLLPKDGIRILEIGSGGGFAVEQIKKAKCLYFPLDIPHSNLNEINKRTDVKIYPVSGDAFHLPLQDNSFEAIILSEVLEHLEFPMDALKEMTRVLKPGGKLLISVPYKEKITYQICVHCNQPTPTHAHFHSFDEKKLTEWVKESGLSLQRFIKISNKLATRLGFYIILKKFSFTIWKSADMLFNLIVPKPSHLILIAGKSVGIK
jgi:ubiquinone/menaquinone biosynthesis C-methylase UbiE